MPFFDNYEIPLLRILTGRGTEFSGKPDTHDYQLFPVLNDIDRTRTKAKNPQTNGICERFHKTILDELQEDLDERLVKYNHRRTHQGKRCQGKAPMKTFMENLPSAKEKMLDMESKDGLAVAA